MRTLTTIVLASASPRRYELLTSLGLDVRVVLSHVLEGDRPGVSPRDLALGYAREKAAAVAARERDALVVAADTVVDVDGRSFGKPVDDTDAASMLRELSGREHLVHTGYAVTDGATGDGYVAVETTRVRFAKLDAATIATYVATGEPRDKAGAYGIQGRGAALVERIDGDYYTVMGFPLGAFVRDLARLGYALPAVAPAGAFA